jgi:diguanylate cyclase (GGDEF)-like protein/PAS domain S-box-containing protein
VSTEETPLARRRLVRQSVAVACAGIGSILVLASLTYLLARDYTAVVDEIDDEAALRATLAQTMQLLVDGQTAQRGYVLTGDRRFLTPLERSRRQLAPTVARLEARLAEKGSARAFDELDTAIAQRVQYTEAVVEHAGGGDLDTARAMVSSGEGQRRMDRVRALVTRIERDEQRRVGLLRANAERAQTRLFGAFLGLVLLTLAIAAYSVSLMRRELLALEDRARQERENERLLRFVAEGASDLVRVYDRSGRLIYVSPSSQRLLGYDADELMALAPGAIVVPEEREEVKKRLDDALSSEDRPAPLTHRLMRKDGTVRWFETRAEPARDAVGEVVRLHMISRDVTERVEAEGRRSEDALKLAKLATRDELTGLYNRRGLHEASVRVFERARSERAPVLLVFCDVNGLKAINDRLGHEAGDGVIKDAASLLSATTRESDVVARLGGDELVVLGVVRDADGARIFEQRLRERIREHNTAADRPYRVSLSIGAAVWLPDQERSLDDLLKEADAAMYAQKRASRSAVTMSGEDVVRSK